MIISFLQPINLLNQTQTAGNTWREKCGVFGDKLQRSAAIISTFSRKNEMDCCSSKPRLLMTNDERFSSGRICFHPDTTGTNQATDGTFSENPASPQLLRLSVYMWNLRKTKTAVRCQHLFWWHHYDISMVIFNCTSPELQKTLSSCFYCSTSRRKLLIRKCLKLQFLGWPPEPTDGVCELWRTQWWKAPERQ